MVNISLISVNNHLYTRGRRKRAFELGNDRIMNRFSIRIKLFYICLSGLLFLMIYSRFNIKGIVEQGCIKIGVS